MTPLLTTSGLTRIFGGLRAVDGVDFAVMPGEIRAVIGPNGAGKTTFVSLVCGRIPPSSGTIVPNNRLAATPLTAGMESLVTPNKLLRGAAGGTTVNQYFTLDARHGRERSELHNFRPRLRRRWQSR